MNPPPQRFYLAYIQTNVGLRYLSMVQAVGPNQARDRVLADWKDTAPQMVEDIKNGKVKLVLRRSGIKKASREASNIPSQPDRKIRVLQKAGFFKAFGDRIRVRMEVKQPYLNTEKRKR